MNYRAIQQRLDALTHTLAETGIFWDRNVPEMIQLRRDARLPFALHQEVHVLLNDVRGWYYDASREDVGDFVQGLRKTAIRWDRKSPSHRTFVETLMTLALRAEQEERRLVEEYTLLIKRIQLKPLLPGIAILEEDTSLEEGTSSPPDHAPGGAPPPDATPPADGTPPVASWGAYERDFRALWKLSLAVDTGRFDVAARQEMKDSALLLRRAVETWQTTTEVPVGRSLNDMNERILAAMQEVEGADEGTRRNKAMHVVLDTMAIIAGRVANSDELKPFAEPAILKDAMEDVQDFVWNMRGAVGREISLGEIDFSQVIAAWQDSDDPEKHTASAELDIRVSEWNKHPEAAQEEWQRWQRGGPPAPVGWREAMNHLAERLEAAGLVWHPLEGRIYMHSSARIPTDLARDMETLLARLRAWYFASEPDEETRRFAADLRTGVETWRERCLQSGEVKWLEGAAALERLVFTTEYLGHSLPEASGRIVGEMTGHWPYLVTAHPVAPPVALDEAVSSASTEKQVMTPVTAYDALWRLVMAWHKSALAP